MKNSNSVSNITQREDITKDRLAAAQRLRDWRTSKNYSMADISDIITDRGYHCVNHTYRNWELGSLPPLEVLLILRRLGLDLNWYINGQ